VRLGICCCGAPDTHPDAPCGSTSTVPQPWPDRIYTIDVSGSFGTTLMRVSMNDQGQDCAGEPEPNCREEALALYWIEACCDADGNSGSVLRKVALGGSTDFRGSFEFDSRGRQSDAASCTRHIPASKSVADPTSAICPADMPGPSVSIVAIYECSKQITNCTTGIPNFGAPCLDVSEVRITFAANTGATYTYRELDCTTSEQCFSASLTGTAVYRRAKVATDTHVAVGVYSMVWSEAPYGDSCGTGNPTVGCPGSGPFPRTIEVKVKP